MTFSSFRLMLARLLRGAPVAPPVNIAPPVISGSPVVGSTLSAVRGLYEPTPTGYIGRWTADGAPIPGATGLTYVLAEGDVGVAEIEYTEIPLNGEVEGDAATSNAIGPIEAGEVVAAKWRNFSFRSTLNGAATWAGGGLNVGADIDPNDDTQVTTVVIGPAPLYPALSADGVNSYGKAGGANTAGTDASKTNAGGNPLLAGNHSLSSIGQTLQFDGQAGEYEVRIGMNTSSSAAASIAVLFDGTAAQLDLDLGASSFYLWAPATAYATNALVVSRVDMGVWKLTSAAGTSSTVEPSGAGPTFVDGAMTWTRLSRNALHVFGGTAANAASVVDTTGFSVAAAAWGENKVRATISGLHGAAFTLKNCRSGPLYLRQFGMRLLSSPLEAVAVYDEFRQRAETPTLYAGQPEGYAALRIVPVTGANTAANFSLAGDLAGYFDVAAMGAQVWLVANSTRLPDAMAGPQTLQIIQTDAASPGSPYTTSFEANIISSQGRVADGSTLGLISTQTHLSRKVVKDVTDSMWPGYAGQAFASDQLVTGGDDLVAKLVGLNPDGSSWYRLRLGAGTYEGLRNTEIRKDFGAGGLLIERDGGADPEINLGLLSLQIHGLDWRDTTFTNDASKTGAYQQLNFLDPGPGGILGGGRFNKVKIHHSRIGFMFASGASVTEWKGKASSFLALSHGESAEISDCQFKGSGATFLPNGVRALKYVDIDNQLSMDDMIGMTHARSVTSTQDVFEDNDIYLEMSRITTWNEPDYEGYDNGNHNDFGQTYKGLGSPALWEHTMAWSKVGTNTLNMMSDPPRLYKVVTAGTTAASGSGPSGAGTGIEDGTVVWDYVGDALFGDFHVLLEGNTLSSQGPIAGKNARQFFLDSNGGRGCAMNLTAIDNLTASGSIFGISIGEGALNVEFNTLASSANLKATDTIQAAVFKSSLGGTVRSLHNVGRAASQSATGLAMITDEILLNWSAAAVAPNRPGDVLAGLFEQDGSGRWTYPSLIDDGSITPAEFAAQMRAHLVVLSGAAGIRT